MYLDFYVRFRVVIVIKVVRAFRDTRTIGAIRVNAAITALLVIM